MDEEPGTRADQTREEALDLHAPPDVAALEAGYLVPRETADGVRYVRSRRRPPRSSNLSRACLGALVVLVASTVAAIILLVNGAADAGVWRLLLGFLYPLQLALDAAAVVRSSWRSIAYWVGGFEVELSADRLRTGVHCGALWIDEHGASVADVARLVIGKRPEAESSTIWELMAERRDGSHFVLLSADDPGNVIPLAKDLHARLTLRQKHRDRWPALSEENRPAGALPDRPPVRPLFPGGGWTWLGIHVLGSFGLCEVYMVARSLSFLPPWRIALVFGMAVLQVIIFLANVAYLRGGGKTSSESS